MAANWLQNPCIHVKHAIKTHPAKKQLKGCDEQMLLVHSKYLQFLVFLVYEQMVGFLFLLYIGSIT